MMARTDRHFRYFLRLLTRRTLLYSEMVVYQAIEHGDRDYLLGYDESEHPLVLQLGGDDPEGLARAARIAQDWGYDEVNLNVGCPSDRVQSGNFGVCLMKEPDTVARCIEAMMKAVDIPVTVKHRIGVDDLDAYDDMANFVEVVRQTGCDRFTVHARKAWLKGLSPKENRNIPPLRYEDVYRLKTDFPELIVEINGGVKTHDEIREHLKHVDAVMIGRAAYDDPFLFAEMDSRYFDETSDPYTDRHSAIEAMYPYIEAQRSKDVRLSHITRHLLALFNGMPGARRWRRHLSENAVKEGAGVEVLQQALALVPREEATAAAI